MTITLEDVSKIFALPLDGDVVASHDIDENWKTSLLEHFYTAQRKEGAPIFAGFKEDNCIPLNWLIDLFSVWY
jgi:hypothetical protein